uniref:Neurotransmitter-gated ion-channel transmembrane domain-containing protein n=1 Tax=Acrobeloides nanus TaxID=290746 RepID=A0A914CP43_9BILA
MDSSKLRLALVNGSDNLELYVRNAEWSLTDFAARVYEKQYDCCPHPFVDINYFMVLKRSPSYYIFSLVIPSAFITVVTIVGFFTPHSTTGENTEKVSLGVTALLSMAIIMMMVSDEVPATSEVIPLIGKYYIGLIFLIFLAAFTTTLTLSFQMRGNAGNRMSPRLKYILFEKIAKNPIVSWLFAVQLAHKRNLGRSRNFEPNTFIFENNNTEGVTCKIKVTPNGKTKHAKIVQMEELTGNINKYSIDCDSKNCSQYVFLRIYECIETIEQTMVQDHEQTNIKFEWEQATRIIERLIMIVYIILTVVFATYMLFGRAEDLRLSNENMDALKA